MEKELKEELLDHFDENEVEALPILMQEILAEFQKLRAEVAGYRSAICFETTCTGCAGLLDQMVQLEAERNQFRNDAKWLFDDFAWEDHWRYCDLPEGECDQCKSLVEMKARYGWG